MLEKMSKVEEHAELLDIATTKLIKEMFGGGIDASNLMLSLLVPSFLSIN